MGRVVEFKELQKMPEGTIFSSVDGMIAGVLCVKGESIGDNDFWYQELMCFGDFEEAHKTLILGKDQGNQDIEQRYTNCLKDKFHILSKSDIDMVMEKLKRFTNG